MLKCEQLLSYQNLLKINVSLFQVFAGNTDRNTVITHSLKPHIEARYIRIHPKTHNHNGRCLRAELYGCRKGKYAKISLNTVSLRQWVI